MSTFADRARAMPLAAELAVARRRYADAEVAALVDLVQAEYVVRYGGPDETPMDPAQFDPPTGMFLIGSVGGQAVACGGWRSHQDVDAELKRMFVVAAARRRGYAARMLAELENSARAAGKRRLVLETGAAQPEAVAMYERAGYRPIAGFGYYCGKESAIHLGKVL